MGGSAATFSQQRIVLAAIAFGVVFAFAAHAGADPAAPLPAPVIRAASAAQPDDLPAPPPPLPDVPSAPTPVEAVPLPAAETPAAPAAGTTALPAPLTGSPDAFGTGSPTPPPAWSSPAPASVPTYAAPATPSTVPCPPPPRYTQAPPRVVSYTYPCTGTTVPTQSVAATPLRSRTWSGCGGLPCCCGISMWHVRLVGGVAFYTGDDAPEECGYFGADFGRTHCGCWGYDVYYRWSSAQFERTLDPTRVVPAKDGGYTHHFGLKLTYERPFGNSRFYWWAGLGAGYFITQDYWYDDEGFEGFGELGIGYVLGRNWRVRLGVNVHAMDTKVTRESYLDDGDSRLLWLIAPVLEVEIDF